MGRISIAGVLGSVAVFAIGLAALVNATTAWAGVAFTLTVGVLFASVLATILRGWRRGGWLGLALFGWGYFLLGNLSSPGPITSTWLLPDAASEWIFSKANPPPIPPTSSSTNVSGSRPMIPQDTNYYIALERHNHRAMYATNIGRWLSVLLFAGVGAILGVLLARGRRANDAAPPPA